VARRVNTTMEMCTTKILLLNRRMIVRERSATGETYVMFDNRSSAKSPLQLYCAVCVIIDIFFNWYSVASTPS
jgi:hypothetical protein